MNQRLLPCTLALTMAGTALPSQAEDCYEPGGVPSLNIQCLQQKITIQGEQIQSLQEQNAGMKEQNAALIKTLSQVERMIYSNDFSSSAGAEWSDPTRATANGEWFLGTSADGFGAGTNVLTLHNIPTHSKLKVEFDLYIIRTWDGNGPAGPDNWQLTADGISLLLTSFSNIDAPDYTQAYPNQLPPHGSSGSFVARTGTFENGHLGLGAGDATYRLSYTFAHSVPSLELKFTSMQNQAPGDEGWGLDNVRVSIVP